MLRKKVMDWLMIYAIILTCGERHVKSKNHPNRANKKSLWSKQKKSLMKAMKKSQWSRKKNSQLRIIKESQRVNKKKKKMKVTKEIGKR